MGKTKASGKASKKAKAAKKQAPPSKGISNRFLTCPTTQDKVFVGTATLQDIKNPPTSQKRKLLLKVPSAKTRKTLYDELSLCLEDMETRLLPKYGGRPWQVICRVQDNGASPFFRWFRGKLEVAALPHLLEKIPPPPKFPGYEQTEHGVRRMKAATANNDDDDDEESTYDNLTDGELQRMESLQGREISSLSQVAWDHRNDKNRGAPIPTISVKWTCPLRQIFTTRKAAWDHALELAKAEQYIDRYLHGKGARGVLLKPFRPTRKHTLQAGKVRFLRDGLWVVGQEQHWQLERMEELEQEKREQEAAAARAKERKLDAKANKVEEAAATGASEPLKKRRRLGPSSMFVHVNKHAHKEKRLKELLKEAPKSNKHAQDANDKETGSKTADKVGLPPTNNKKPKKVSTSKVSFTLRDAENELREMWKKLPQKEQQSWEAKAEASFYRKLELDEQARIDAEESGSEEEEEEDEEEEDNGDEEQRGEDGADEVADKSKPGSEEQRQTEENEEETSEEESVVELATDDERSFWEALSHAEQRIWGTKFVAPKPKKKCTKKSREADAAMKDSIVSEPAAEEKKEDPQDVLPIKLSSEEKADLTKPSYEEYQAHIFDKVLNMTVAEYEKYLLKGLRASARAKVLKELRERKELKEQGMRQLTASAQIEFKKRLGRSVGESINRAYNKNEKLKMEASEKGRAVCEKTPGHLMPPIQSHGPAAAAGSTALPAHASAALKPDPPTHSSAALKPDPPGTAAAASFPASSEVVAQEKQVAATGASLPRTIEVAMDSKMASNSIPISPSPTLGDLAQQESSPDKKRSRDSEGSAVPTRDDHSSASTSMEEPQEPLFTVTEHFCLNDKQIKLCKEASMEHFDAVMRTVKAKDLTRELVDGFDVLRERGRGRYDMELPAFDKEEFSFLTDIQKAPWMPIVRQVLGDDVVLIHKGCFLSLPGAANQNYHQDGTHLRPNSQRPCHAVNVFVPLVDMTRHHGPTEFCLGSHILGQEDWDARFIETPLPKKGVPVMFDYRLGHRGMGNTSNEPRPIVYCTYARANDGKEFRDSVNFSRKRYRPLGELVEKPLSREERNEKRRSKKDDAYYESLF